MINVHFEGDNRHRLEDAAGTNIGWIRGRAIGFVGMRDEHEAMTTVLALWEPLQTALAQHFPGRPHHVVHRSRLGLAHDGAFEWITDEQLPLARYYRRPSDARGAGSAIEFALPSYANEGVVISVAHVLATALVTYRSTLKRTMPTTRAARGREAIA
jgi:hypothetical protein